MIKFSKISRLYFSSESKYIKKLNLNNIKKNEKIHKTLNKNNLKKIILHFQKNYGELYTFYFLENLKKIGFKFATKAGLSLGIDDLKVFSEKKNIILKAKKNINLLEKDILKQNVSPYEKSQYLLSKWTYISNKLINQIKLNLSKDLPLNPLGLMAFSGARGNISQITQLIGVRGLMADPLGRIVEFPIQTNFKEGITLTEYFISCYGARKGLIDTALRTANAGYLTRRLIYVAQHLYVSIEDCKTKKGISFSSNNNFEEVKGLSLLNNFYKSIFIPKKSIFSNYLQKKLKTINLKNLNKLIVFRSILTCNLYHTVCQSCYGWDVSNSKRVAIGEAVGILAAQSIGEPGTQLTLRTFHTGGVGSFSGSTINSIISPIEGTILFKNPVMGQILRSWVLSSNSNLNHLAYKISNFYKKNSSFFMIESLNKKYFYKFFNENSLLFVKQKEYVKKGHLLFYNIQENLIKLDEVQNFVPFYSPNTGKIIRLSRNKSYFPLWVFFFDIINFKYQNLNNNLFKFSKYYSIIKKNDLISSYTLLMPIFIVNKDIFIIKEKFFYESLTFSLFKNYKKSVFFKINEILKRNNQNLNINVFTKYSNNYKKKFYFLWDTLKYYNNFVQKIVHYKFIFKNLDLSMILNDNFILWKNFSKILKKHSYFNFYKFNNKKKEKMRLKKKFFIIKKNKIIIYNKNLHINFILNNNYKIKLLLNKINYFIILKKLIIYSRKKYKQKYLINLEKFKDNNFKVSTKTIFKYFKLLHKLNNIYTIQLNQPTILNGEFCGQYKKENKIFWYTLPLNKKNTFEKKDILLHKNNIKFNFIRWNTKNPISGYLISNSLNNFTIQLGTSYIFPLHTIYHKLATNNSFIFKNSLICSFKTKKQKTKDIIQGIPKIEKLFEGRALFEFIPKLELWLLWGELFDQYNSLSIKNALILNNIIEHEIYSEDIQYKFTKLTIGELCNICYFYTIINFGRQLISSIINVYSKEGVILSFKHIELIIQELLSLVEVIDPGDSGFFLNEKINKNLACSYNEKLKLYNLNEIIYIPSIFGMTELAENKEFFGVSGSFQNLREIIIKSTLIRKTDYLLGLHENILFNKIIPSGTGYFFL